MAKKNKKQTGKWFADENIQRISVKGKIYIGKKKEKANLVIPIEKKNQKTRNWTVKRKKNTVRAAKLQCKSAQY